MFKRKRKERKSKKKRGLCEITREECHPMSCSPKSGPQVSITIRNTTPQEPPRLPTSRASDPCAQGHQSIWDTWVLVSLQIPGALSGSQFLRASSRRLPATTVKMLAWTTQNCHRWAILWPTKMTVSNETPTSAQSTPHSKQNHFSSRIWRFKKKEKEKEGGGQRLYRMAHIYVDELCVVYDVKFSFH